MNSNNSNGGFVNGFLWGAIIGASVVFLLGTKKGKRLLKTVTEEGLEGVSGLKELVEEYSGDEE
ncbi:MAG: YtxH domain-containing protein [Candidatus Levybacteria bacterium]|nr:YtxH domain-containing protein [Candidatus Levybacteria bacterium]